MWAETNPCSSASDWLQHPALRSAALTGRDAATSCSSSGTEPSSSARLRSRSPAGSHRGKRGQEVAAEDEQEVAAEDEQEVAAEDEQEVAAEDDGTHGRKRHHHHHHPHGESVDGRRTHSLHHELETRRPCVTLEHKTNRGGGGLGN